MPENQKKSNIKVDQGYVNLNSLSLGKIKYHTLIWDILNKDAKLVSYQIDGFKNILQVQKFGYKRK